MIQAFNPAEGDRIDLAAIDAIPASTGDQAFTWRGTAPFTGAVGELRYDVSGADVVVQAMLTGPGVSFELRVAGLGVLTGADFTL